MAAVADHATPTYDRMKEVKEFDESKIGVKGLAESGITSIPRMFIHSPEARSDLKKPNPETCTKKTIPLIDLSHFNSPTERHQLVEQMRDATSTWGFFQVINHGIPKSVLDETINAIKAFHDQPHEVKSKLCNREKERQGVMYSSNNDLYRAKAASWHDSLTIWMAPETRRAKEEDIPEVCRKEIVAWESHSTKVAEALLELLSEGLGVEAERFKDLGFLEGKLVVGHCYPYCPQPDLTVGITSHTDSGLTVLLQNQVGGLQVKHGDEWVDVEPIPGALTVNIGDFIQVPYTCFLTEKTPKTKFKTIHLFGLKSLKLSCYNSKLYSISHTLFFIFYLFILTLFHLAKKFGFSFQLKNSSLTQNDRAHASA